MTAAPITTFYAAILSLLFIVLAARVIAQRRASGITLGTANNSALERAARVHANFAEFVPLALILLLLAEFSGFPRWTLHAAGLVLLTARAVHAWGVSQAEENFALRTIGIAATLTVIMGLALALLVRVIVS
jgi:uncharacterized membrane protein YecN with MAPEG domain